MKYIIYRNYEGDRKIVVVDGKAYYESTGTASKMPKVWLPFIAMLGAKPLHLESYTPKLTRENIYSIYGYSYGYIIKKSFTDSLFANQNSSDWCAYSLEVTTKWMSSTLEFKDNLISDFTPNNLFIRLYLKEDFVNSFRLRSFVPSKDISIFFKKAGLNNTQIRLAKTPIILDDHPEYIMDDPDQINEWLMKNGATYLAEITRGFPYSYTHIWDKTDAEDFKHADQIKLHQKKVTALLSDYTKNNSMIKLFFTGHCNRHHVQLVEEALRKKYNHPLELIINIRCCLGDALKSDGSLGRRLSFMEQQFIVDEETAEFATFYFSETQKKYSEDSDVLQTETGYRRFLLS